MTESVHENRTGEVFAGLDFLKFIMAVLIAWRHIVQLFFPADSPMALIIGMWLSNLGVPVFFTISGFFLFRKLKHEPEADWKRVKAYCLRMLRMYVIWMILYLPIALFNFRYSGQSFAVFWSEYLHQFLFEPSVPQLWYLPGLAAAVLVVWVWYKRGGKVSYLLAIGFLLFAAGLVGNTGKYMSHLPSALMDPVGQKLYSVYIRIFRTTRNGIFYGIVFVCMGWLLAEREKKYPGASGRMRRVLQYAAGAAAGIGLLYFEVRKCLNPNMAFMTIPAAYFLFLLAAEFRAVKGERAARASAFLREMSTWVFLIHFYYFYFYWWIQIARSKAFSLNPWQICGILLFLITASSALLTLLSETEKGSFLKRLL